MLISMAQEKTHATPRKTAAAQNFLSLAAKPKPFQNSYRCFPQIPGGSHALTHPDPDPDKTLPPSSPPFPLPSPSYPLLLHFPVASTISCHSLRALSRSRGAHATARRTSRCRAAPINVPSLGTP